MTFYVLMEIGSGDIVYQGTSADKCGWKLRKGRVFHRGQTLGKAILACQQLRESVLNQRIKDKQSCPKT